MDKIGLQKLNNNYRFQDTFPIDYIRHRFWLSKYYSIYKRYPDTLTMGIAKVGGLVAIFKVGFFLQHWHKRRYYSSLVGIHKQSRIVSR